MRVKILLDKWLGERHMSQTDLAKKTGIRKATISEMYNSVCTSVKIEHIVLICEALDCDVKDLFRLDGKN
jgi:putative transcriptional regulator